MLSAETRERLTIALTDRYLGAEVADAIDRLTDGTIEFHEPLVTPASAGSLPGTAPTLNAIGPVLVLVFSSADAAWRSFKIPANFAGNPRFHIHWTKSTDANEQGRAVKWRVTYAAFPGEGEAIQALSHVVDYEDVYEDAGTTTRVLHRTPDLPLEGLAGVEPGYYLGIKVERVSPTGAALTQNPALFSLDLTFDIRPNATE